MSKLSSIIQPIEQDLIRFNKTFKTSMKSDVPLLNVIVNYLLKSKGKQLRPIFVFLSARMFGSVTEKSYTAASLIEMLHTATLIHDDVVDEAHERRNMFSINALWKSKVAVLLGDYLLAKGLLLSLDKQAYDLLHVVSDAVREMSEGEIIQIKNSRKAHISEADYFEVIDKKTASLIAACTACGALSAGADEKSVSAMKEFGRYAGIAFQIKDDLFDYEKKSLVGKPTGNDIKQKKITLPLIYALSHAPDKERKKISGYIKNKKKISQIIAFAHEQGGIDYARKKMEEHILKAHSILDQYPENEAVKSLQLLLDYIAERKQ